MELAQSRAGESEGWYLAAWFASAISGLGATLWTFGIIEQRLIEIRMALETGKSA